MIFRNLLTVKKKKKERQFEHMYKDYKVGNEKKDKRKGKII